MALPSLLVIARTYLGGGLSVIPVRADGSKRPALDSWKEYQRRRPTEAELAAWFGREARGIAIVCGAVSGGLEVLDFDDGETFASWRDLLDDQAPGLLARLPVVRTPAGGAHVYYRCQRPDGNRKLARNASGQTLIETRGEGGYVLAPGCPPACHPTGAIYRLSAGADLTRIPLLPEAGA